ncbi:hypothetical protein [Streptomyces sp. RKAG337]|uniref:hypothetical protein n=1 Tax=Streptomyces sp. RKAG337 TaxID=2893404 RepID=UPI002034683C|nr:hypothetical protein [Streptomyces sp. RKAG337]MCM2427709.1 hypothetical protein [Streptomyces sp. RKAG337]
MPFDPFAPSDPFEEDLGQAIRGTAGTFSTDNRALVDAGAARGRVMRLRRRAAVAGGAATLTLVAVGGLMAGGMSGSAGHHVAEDPAARGGPQPVAVASGERVTAQHMINLLKSALPPGVTTGGQGRGTGAEGTGGPIGAPYAEVVYDDGHGPGLVSVSLNHAPAGQGVGPGTGTRCPDRVYVPFDSCDRSVLADGSVLVLLKGYEYPDHRVTTKNWRATLTTRDGQVVDAMEWNSPAEKGSPDTRPDPPLTAAQLTALVNVKIWKPVFDALGPTKVPADRPTTLPAEQPAIAEASSSVPGPAISAVLKGLIPAGLKRSDADDSEGFAHVTVNDGHGKTLIEVNVDRWPPKDPDTLAFFSGGEKLADGTRVLVSQGPAEKGGAGTVQWVAQILRPNGRRIVVAELNAGGYHQPATRTAPVFTIDRLRAMALSPDWKKLG